MESNNHFNYGTHSSANSGLKLSSGDSLYTNGSSMSFPQQGKSKCFTSCIVESSYFIESAVTSSLHLTSEFFHMAYLCFTETALTRLTVLISTRYEWRDECEWRHYCTRVRCAWFPPDNGRLPTHEQPPPEQHGLRLPVGGPPSVRSGHGRLSWARDAPEAADAGDGAASVTAPLPESRTVPTERGH